MAESHAVIPIAEYRRTQSIINDLEEKVSISLREIERLETALRPFANAYIKATADTYRQGWLTTMGNWLELKHFRDAAVAIFSQRDERLLPEPDPIPEPALFKCLDCDKRFDVSDHHFTCPFCGFDNLPF